MIEGNSLILFRDDTNITSTKVNIQQAPKNHQALINLWNPVKTQAFKHQHSTRNHPQNIKQNDQKPIV